MNSTQILSRDEIVDVLSDLHDHSELANSWMNLIIFRLSCCCGLRCKEIVCLDVGDLQGGSRAAIKIRKDGTKRTKRVKGQREKEGRARVVPLWWDEGTANDLLSWKEWRQDQGARVDDPFVCGQILTNFGRRLEESLVAKRWKTAIRCLGPERVRQLSIHCGRRSFCSHALHVGRSLVEVRDAVGHGSIHTTSIYSHLLEREGVGDIFG